MNITINHKLIVKSQTGNLFDPYAIGLFTKEEARLYHSPWLYICPERFQDFQSFIWNMGAV